MNQIPSLATTLSAAPVSNYPADALTISLVAIQGDTLLGHVAFSPVSVDGADRGWFGLGPVSVKPDRQREGIGTALIEHGLGLLRSRDASGCVVLGDPVFYNRFGFQQDAGLRYEGPPPECFMQLKIAALEVPTGRVEYAPAFTG